MDIVLEAPKSAPRSDRPQEFSLSKIWTSPSLPDLTTGHRLVTSMGATHARQKSFKKPLMFPLFYHSRKHSSPRSESPQEVAEEAEISNPLGNPVSAISRFPKSVLSPGRLQSLHRRSTKPCDFAAVVHTDPDKEDSPKGEVTCIRVATTTATVSTMGNHWEEDPPAILEAPGQEFSYEEQIRAGKSDSRLEASLDFGEK